MSRERAARRIFISSTAEDLKEHRATAFEAIERLDLAAVRMESFGAKPGDPVSVCKDLAASADALVVVVAHRYGWIPTQAQGGDDHKSITRLEVEAARRAKVPVFAFIVDDAAPWTQRKEQDALTDPSADPVRVMAAVQGLRSFKEWLLGEAGLVADRFTNADQLAWRVSTSLSNWSRGVATTGARPGAEAWKKSFPLFLDALWRELRPLRLYAATRPDLQAAEVPVFSVYTELHVTRQVALGADPEQALERRGAGHDPWQPALRAALDPDLRCEAAQIPERERERYARPVRALEAVAALPRLVLVGAPGGGKSTFVQHLALCLAGDLLGEEPRASVERLRALPPGGAAWMPWEQEAHLPIFVELRRFVRSAAFPAASTRGGSGQLFRYLFERSESPAWQEECRALERQLAACRGAGTLLVLDGLDETPQAEGCRERIQEIVRSFVESFPKARVLVTSRPYAYRADSPWRLEGFAELELAPFSEEQIRLFCGHWYQGMIERDLASSADAAQRGESLWQDLTREPYVMALASRPLMLTMLADLHTQSGRLPPNRARLFEESACLLLDRWNAARQAEGPGENRLTEQLGVSLEQLRRAMEELAFEAQQAGSKSDAATSLRAGQVIDVLRRHGGKGSAEQIVDFLHERAGILVAESGDRYRFPHMSYQEYLAACYLTMRESVAELCQAVARDLERWREVVPLALARPAESAPSRTWDVVEALLAPPEDEGGDANDRGLRALLCARGLIESGLLEGAQERGQHLLERVRSGLVAVCEQGRLAVRDRADAGDLLGQLGDPRLARDPWVSVSAGAFWMGAQDARPGEPGYDEEAFSSESPVHRVRVCELEIARYPVTVAEYARFIAAGGYGEPASWDVEGWEARTQAEWSAPAGWTELARYPSRPVVGVSWYEARAYATWVGARLPSEAEWEWSARGADGRRFPWGSDFDAQACNTAECRLGRVAAVGLFPVDRTEAGVRDLAGNVWEWTEDDHHPTYDGSPSDGSAWIDHPRGSRRVFRGGSWFGVAGCARAAFRLGAHPGARYDGLGFRLARGPQARKPADP